MPGSERQKKNVIYQGLTPSYDGRIAPSVTNGEGRLAPVVVVVAVSLQNDLPARDLELAVHPGPGEWDQPAHGVVAGEGAKYPAAPGFQPGVSASKTRSAASPSASRHTS